MCFDTKGAQPGGLLGLSSCSSYSWSQVSISFFSTCFMTVIQERYISLSFYRNSNTVIFMNYVMLKIVLMVHSTQLVQKFISTDVMKCKETKNSIILRYRIFG